MNNKEFYIKKFKEIEKELKKDIEKSFNDIYSKFYFDNLSVEEIREIIISIIERLKKDINKKLKTK